MASLIPLAYFIDRTMNFDQTDCQEHLSVEHYDLEFVERWNEMECRTIIVVALKRPCRHLSIVKSTEHVVESTTMERDGPLPVEVRTDVERIVLESKRLLQPGNYSISISTRTKVSNTLRASFVRQSWSDDYRVLFTNRVLFPHISSSSNESATWNVNVLSSDQIVSNVPLNETRPFEGFSQLAFALLHRYECRSAGMVQLCLPMPLVPSMDLFTHLMNLTVTSIELLQGYVAHPYPLKPLTLVAVLELNEPFLSSAGLVLIDQNKLLRNQSAADVLQQRQVILFILAYQWLDAIVRTDDGHPWSTMSLARTIADDLSQATPSSLERAMSTVVLDSLCSTESIDPTGDHR